MACQQTANVYGAHPL